LGRFGVRSFVAVTVLFAVAHPEWLAAAVYCVLLNGLVYWKKDLWSCVVAHAVSNLALAVYILTTESWWLW
jgi:ABC-type spermidine/putrescine transport system permease subunit II